MRSISYIFASLSLFLCSCSGVYVLNGVRNENISIDELRDMQYEIGNSVISHNNQKFRHFSQEEEGLVYALNEDLKKNFYNDRKPAGDRCMNIRLEVLTSDENTFGPGCYVGNSISYGFGPFAVSSGRTTQCMSMNTTYSVTAVGTQKGNDKNVLFETRIVYSGDRVDQGGREQEIKRIISSITKYIGKNIADEVSR